MERRGDWIQTATGRQFHPFDPRPEDVCVEDIAHHLANMCRFTGATRSFYSVGEHCVRVSRVVAPENAFAGLLHDAAEAYLVDLPRPLKRSAEFAGAYARAERGVAAAICERFSLPEGAFDHPDVKRADEVLLVTEKRDLMAAPPAPWVETGAEPLEERIAAWPPEAAHFQFLARYYELTGERRWVADVLAIVWRTRRASYASRQELEKNLSEVVS